MASHRLSVWLSIILAGIVTTLRLLAPRSQARQLDQTTIGPPWVSEESSSLVWCGPGPNLIAGFACNSSYCDKHLPLLCVVGESATHSLLDDAARV
jgi:hypothetical protein